MTESSLRVLHVVLLVTWVGIDVGVFLSSFVIRRPGLSADARVEIRRIMRALDLAPRLSLVLMAPVALGLASATGLDGGHVPMALHGLVSVVAIGWVLAMITGYRRLDAVGAPTGPANGFDRVFPRIDLALRVVVIVGFGATGIVSLLGVGPWPAPHIAWKSLLFGLTVAAGLWIRIAARGFTPALREVVEIEETPDRLRRMDRAMHRAYPAVLSVWVGVLAMAVLGITGLPG